MTYQAPSRPVSAPANDAGQRTTAATPPRLMTLKQILAYKRPAGGKTEQVFCNRLKGSLDPYGATYDDFGNIIVVIGAAPAILWSSHTDTVHHTEGLQVVFEQNGMYATDSGECLGADDSTGIWIMCQMIAHGVPGLYIFHREEEIGGNGSLHIAQKTPELLTGVKAAIAFDRKGYTSVITHQGPRTCSDAFAESLCAGLGLDFAPDDTGLFTDTKHYRGLVGECTNLSVGYFGAHTPSESQSIDFPQTLLEAILALDVDALVYKREAGEKDLDSSWGNLGNWGRRPRLAVSEMDLEDLCYEHPRAIAEMLSDCGFTARDVEKYIGDNDDGFLGWN